VLHVYVYVLIFAYKCFLTFDLLEELFYWQLTMGP